MKKMGLGYRVLRYACYILSNVNKYNDICLRRKTTGTIFLLALDKCLIYRGYVYETLTIWSRNIIFLKVDKVAKHSV